MSTNPRSSSRLYRQRIARFCQGIIKEMAMAFLRDNPPGETDVFGLIHHYCQRVRLIIEEVRKRIKKEEEGA